MTTRAKVVTGSVSAAADVIASTAVENYATYSVQVTGTFVGTVQWQASNDGTTWVALRAQKADDATAVNSSTTTPALFRGSLGFRFFRLTCTAYTSGTISAVLLLQPAAIGTTVKST